MKWVVTFDELLTLLCFITFIIDILIWDTVLHLLQSEGTLPVLSALGQMRLQKIFIRAHAVLLDMTNILSEIRVKYEKQGKY